jgi:hypothetical protein
MIRVWLLLLGSSGKKFEVSQDLVHLAGKFFASQTFFSRSGRK